METNNFSLVKKEILAENKSLSVSLKTVCGKFPVHTHDYFELEFILSGQGENYVNAKTQSLTRGSMMFLTPADCHKLDFNVETKLWNISFDKSLVSEEWLFKLYSLKEYKTFFCEDELKNLIACAELLEKESQSIKYAKPLVEYLLSHVVTDDRESRLDDFNKAVKYINMNFRENLTVNEVAKIAYLSPVYFGQVFKKRLGICFTEYLNDKRIQLAKKLLKNGMNVTETCFESGFNTISNFVKCFKKIVGVSPKTYQKSFL